MTSKDSFNCLKVIDNLKCVQDLHPLLKETIKNIIETEGYIFYTISKKILNTQGGNFLGELVLVEVKGETEDGEKLTSIFSKKRIIVDKIKIASVEELYEREFFFYSEIAKAIIYLQDQANLPEKDRFKTTKLYAESNKEILIFENLAKNGFKVYDRLYMPPLKYVELAVEEIAKFHGISFVMEHKMPEFYQKKIKTLKCPYQFDKDWEGLMQNIYTRTANLFDEKIKRKLVEFLAIAMKKMPQCERDQTTVRCSLTHGDYRTSNILFRETNGEPVEVMLVDYQLMDYGCSLRDFLFFIFSCTDRIFRKKHMENLKELYYETLSRYLKYFDLNVEAIYPREEFEIVYKKWMDYGLISVMFASPFLFAPDTGLDVKTLSLSELPFNPDEHFKKRALGWIEDFMEWGYL